MKKLIFTILFSLLAQVSSAEYMGELWIDPSWVKLHEAGSMKIVSAVARQLFIQGLTDDL